MTPADEGIFRLLATKQTILLDFDGPICSIFHGYPAPLIAEELRSTVRSQGLPVTPRLAATDDPLDVLRYFDRTEFTRVIATALQHAEVKAAASAQPTRGAHEFIRAAAKTNRRLAIVSNNSEEAIKTYLERHALAQYINVVAARYEGMSPALMKPHTHLICLALNTIGSSPMDAVLVGDSVTDIQAARQVPIPSIGYADEPSKADALRTAGADALVTSMVDIADYYIHLSRQTRHQDSN